MLDLQTRTGRLTKTKVSDHFKPELDDDSFGFKNEQSDFTLIQLITSALIVLPIIWLVLTVLFTMTPNI